MEETHEEIDAAGTTLLRSREKGGEGKNWMRKEEEGRK